MVLAMAPDTTLPAARVPAPVGVLGARRTEYVFAPASSAGLAYAPLAVAGAGALGASRTEHAAPGAHQAGLACVRRRPRERIVGRPGAGAQALEETGPEPAPEEIDGPSPIRTKFSR